MSSAPTNRQIRLVRRPDGIPRDGDFALVPAPIPAVGAGEFLIRADYLSADPLQRWRMAETAGYGATIELGTTVWGRAVGRVVASRNEGWPVGTVVEAYPRDAAPSACLVEFSDAHGCVYAFATVPVEVLLVLHYVPSDATIAQG